MPLAGQIIRTTDFPPSVEIRQATSVSGFTSGTWSPTSPACEGTFTAGTSGRGMLHLFVRVATDGAGEYIHSSVEVREDDSSGAVVHSPNEAAEGIDYRPASNLNQNADGWVRLSGLEAGRTYHVQMQHETNGTIDILEQVVEWAPRP